MTAFEKPSTNPYLQGNFAPVAEEVELSCPEIEGKIPEDLYGTFFRNGPNAEFRPKKEELYHWFDGDGMIHSIEFKDGKAHYRNRWIETKGLQIERQEGKALWDGYLSLPDFDNAYGMPTKNLANTALVWHADRLLALWEAGPAHEVKLPELATTGMEQFDGKWTGAFTAHPTVDPVTGEMMTFCYSPMKAPYVRYGVVNKDGEVVHKTGIELKGKPVMIHDCAITQGHTLILDMPITFDLDRVMNGGNPFDWDPDNGARIGVIPRFGEGHETKWFDVSIGFIFHVLNAYEEGDEVILEACKADKTTVLADKDQEENNHVEQKARLVQYRLNLKTGEAIEQEIDPVRVEFTRINENYMGQKNRFGYGSRFCLNTSKPLFDAVIKFDREQDTKEVYELGDQIFCGEFVFAPKVGSSSEDDGYYIGFIRDEKNQTSECYILDAQKFSEGPVARIKMPKRVPYGFHAHWVDGQAIEAQKTKLG